MNQRQQANVGFFGGLALVVAGVASTLMVTNVDSVFVESLFFGFGVAGMIIGALMMALFYAMRA